MLSRNGLLLQERQSAIAEVNSYIIFVAGGQRNGLSSSKGKGKILKHDHVILKIILSHSKVTLN
jgi:hypothetical protein